MGNRLVHKFFNNSTRERNEEYVLLDLSSWMSELPEKFFNVPLTNIAIPGLNFFLDSTPTFSHLFIEFFSG